MLKITEENNKDLYYDLDKCVEFCKSIEETVYNNKTPFHMFWNVGYEFGRKQLLPIKSYLSTQNLKNTEFILWSNIDLTTNEHLKPYLKLINFKIWDPLKEAENTILEGRKDILNINDNLNWLAGDIFRALCLHNYGGVYIDGDIVLLRDFAPLLDQEFMYKWSHDPELINSAVMRCYKQSKLTKDILKTISETSPEPNTACFSASAYVKVRKFNNNWTVFPCGFFNPEWVYSFTENEKNDPKNAEFLNFVRLPMKKTEFSKILYDGTFSWHWHNNWNTTIETGSKWQIMEEMIDNLLIKKGIL